MLVDVKVVVILNHVVVFLDEGPRITDGYPGSLVVIMLRATFYLLQRPLQLVLVVLIHLVQVDGHVLNLVRLFQRVRKLLIFVLMYQFVLVQIKSSTFGLILL